MLCLFLDMKKSCTSATTAPAQSLDRGHTQHPRSLRLEAAVALLAALCYLNTLSGSFVFDDRRIILENRDADPYSSTWASILSHDYWGVNILYVRQV